MPTEHGSDDPPDSPKANAPVGSEQPSETASAQRKRRGSKRYDKREGTLGDRMAIDVNGPFFGREFDGVVIGD